MKILIKNIKGEVFGIECELNETIADAKQKIFILKQLAPDSQKLILKGVITSNEKSLKELGFKENDFMVLMISKKQENVAIQFVKPQENIIPKISSHPNIDSIEANSPNNNGLVFGSALDQTIESMMNMGFPKSDVIRALHAAYHNPDKALDYLFNGIPDIYMMEQELHTNQQINNNNSNNMSQDELAIERLKSLGFSNETASTAYFASGKNENVAANILLFRQSNPEEDFNDNESAD